MQRTPSGRQMAVLAGGIVLLLLGAVSQTALQAQAVALVCYVAGVLCLAFGIQGGVRRKTCPLCRATLRTPTDQLSPGASVRAWERTEAVSTQTMEANSSSAMSARSRARSAHGFHTTTLAAPWGRLTTRRPSAGSLTATGPWHW